MSLLGGKNKQRSYGSSTKANKTNNCFEHTVKEGDSWQSLAIQYNVSIEDILHVNRMYPTDNIFMKKILKIPVPSLASSSSANLSATTMSQRQQTEERILEQAMDDTAPHSAPMHTSADDFLKAFDSTFASLKDKVHTAIGTTHTETQKIRSTTSSGRIQLEKLKEKDDLLEDDFFQL
eukprot:m.3200 g.3200  ORF g.3200 m.3200 type:complete len:178 (-) comp2030_c0_seq1:826-1359(-)